MVDAGSYAVEQINNTKYKILQAPSNAPIEVTITETNGCAISKTINVADEAELWMDQQRTYCHPIYLVAPLEGNLTWSTGAVNDAIYITETGTYSLSIEMESGCTVTDAITINILETHASFDFVADGLTVQFQNNSVNASSYYWLFGDELSSTDMHPTITFDTPGTYEVTLHARGINDCKRHQQFPT